MILTHHIILSDRPQKVPSGPPLPCGMGSGRSILPSGTFNQTISGRFWPITPSRRLVRLWNHVQSIRNNFLKLSYVPTLFLTPLHRKKTWFWKFCSKSVEILLRVYIRNTIVNPGFYQNRGSKWLRGTAKTFSHQKSAPLACSYKPWSTLKW